MSEAIHSLFSSAPSFDRARFAGIVLLIIGLLVYIIVGKLLVRRSASEHQILVFKCACLAVCAAGALIAIY